MASVVEDEVRPPNHSVGKKVHLGSNCWDWNQVWGLRAINKSVLDDTQQGGVSELIQAVPIDLELDVLVWSKGRFLVYRNSSCILETGFHSVAQTNKVLAIKSRQASNSKQSCVQLPKTRDYGPKPSSMAVGTAEGSQSLDREGMGKPRGDAREGVSNREGVDHAPRKRQHRQWHQSSHTFSFLQAGVMRTWHIVAHQPLGGCYVLWDNQRV